MDKDKRDLILEFISKNYKIGKDVSINTLKESIIELNKLNESQIKILCRNIVEEQPDVAYISELGANKIEISSTEITIPFLKEGGFTEIERIKREKEEKNKLREEKQDKKLDIDIYLGDFEKKQGIKFKQLAFAITVINLIIALSGIFISTQANKRPSNQEFDLEKTVEEKPQKTNEPIEKLERKNDSIYHQKNEVN